MTPHRLTSDDVRRAEALVARVAGVTSCRIRLNGAGEVSEVHVVAAPGRPARAIAREVEDCLRTGMGLDVDHRKIGVVMLEAAPPEEEPAAPAAAPVEEFPIIEHPSRFAFSQVNVGSSRDGVRAEVELTRDGLVVFGSAESDNVAMGAPAVVAGATLRAVSEFLDEPTRLCLGGVLKVPLGSGEAIVVRVDVVGPRHSKSLAGCALLSGDEHRTVVFATLDAVNRLTGKLEFKSSVEYKIR
ncbi:MAG TPA: hypothetical protein VFX92_01875 [Candidatus Krumholzibacteria bacterium]|nr:hypothetical protein [Candidatus Krumholzibacteria bacterium]